jgi:hypothetical protein
LNSPAIVSIEVDWHTPQLIGTLPSGQTNLNLCFSNIPTGPTEADIALLFNDNCGNVNVSKSGTPTGNDCSWNVTYTYTITDDCSNAAAPVTVTYSGGDNEAPQLIGTLPSGQTNLNLCFSNIPTGPTEADIALLFNDNCGNVNVSKSGTPTGNDCSWNVTYTYTITDDCSNAAAPVTVTYSGGDNEAPQLIGTLPSGQTNLNLCFSNIPTGPTEADIALLFNDNCGNVNVSKSGTPTGNDCSWNVTYTYTITDDCSNAAAPVTVTYSGGDNEAPQLIGTLPSGQTNLNLCFSNIPTGPTEADIALLFNDNCGNVNVSKSGTPTGNDCSWNVTYTYTITDDCSNAAAPVTVTYSGGDNEAPQLIGTLPSGQTNLNLCFSNIPTGPTEADIALLFNDNCGNVNVSKSGTPTGNDCSWNVTYTYTITDDCSNAAAPVTVTYSGGDNEAPQLIGTLPSGQTNLNLCFSNIPTGPTEADIALLFNDNCGNVNVSKSGTPTGNDCSWNVTYTYTITDDCSNAAAPVTVTYSGGDNEAPQLIGTLPSGQTNLNLCFSNIPTGPTEADIALLFNDNCGNVNVSKSGTPTGNDCSWNVTYTYTITDDCSNAAAPVTVTYSGGDNEAPQLIGTLPSGQTNLNLCFSNIPTGPTEADIALLFNDNCGNVNVSKSGTPTGNDCSWNVTYTYTITDDCSNAAAPVTVTYSRWRQ